ncbi:MAG: acyl--CoA ligase [Nitrospirae bacterium]|nr:acyl--CoA ligase [Nitrospirota bacterium]
MAKRRPNQEAISVLGKWSVTFREMEIDSSHLANVLIQRGLRKSDRVGVCFTNPEAPWHGVSYFGVQKAGGVVVPLNARLTPREMNELVEHSGARFILAGESAREVLRPFGERVLYLEAIRKDFGAASADQPRVSVAETDPAELIYTSGTTGTPKGVLASHANIVGKVSPAFEMLYGGRTFLNPLPIHTFAGAAYLVFCVRAGMHNIVMEKFDPHTYVDQLEKGGVTTCYAVSPMWLKILKEVPDLDRRDFSHMFSVSFGAAAMPPWAVTRIGELFPNAMIFNIYGLTEAGGAACMLLPGDHRVKPNSVGKPVGECEVRIVDDSGRDRPPGQPGEILMRMPGVKTREYFKDREATSRVWDGEGWTHTGDVGYLDADGYLFLVDRIKDIIIQGGNNVSTMEVEGILLEHPSVREAAVIGLAHDTLGEMVTAFVAVKGGKPVSEDELRSHLKDRLAAYKLPKRVVFVSELPRNPMGKVLKKELRQRYQGFEKSMGGSS